MLVLSPLRDATAGIAYGSGRCSAASDFALGGFVVVAARVWRELRRVKVLIDLSAVYLFYALRTLTKRTSYRGSYAEPWFGADDVRRRTRVIPC